MSVSTGQPSASDAVQRELNTRIWGGGGFVRSYRGRWLRPVESVLLERYRDRIAGHRVLELGCGGGRLTGHMIEAGGTVSGTDIAADMVAHCQRAYPGGTFWQADIRDLTGFETAAYDLIVAGFSLIDVLTDDERGVFLDGVHRMLAPGGTFIVSSHNIAVVPEIKGPLQSLSRNPIRLANRLLRLPRSLSNRRRLAPLQRFEGDFAIVNDVAHDYALLHYYIGRDAQERQLAAHEFRLIECLDLTGKVVPPGGTAPGCHELHYVAERLDGNPAVGQNIPNPSQDEG